MDCGDSLVKTWFIYMLRQKQMSTQLAWGSFYEQKNVTTQDGSWIRQPAVEKMKWIVDESDTNTEREFLSVSQRLPMSSGTLVEDRRLVMNRLRSITDGGSRDWNLVREWSWVIMSVRIGNMTRNVSIQRGAQKSTIWIRIHCCTGLSTEPAGIGTELTALPRKLKQPPYIQTHAHPLAIFSPYDQKCVRIPFAPRHRNKTMGHEGKGYRKKCGRIQDAGGCV